MPLAIIDTNCLVDVTLPESAWFRWSSEALAWVADRMTPAIDPIIYSELGAGFPDIESIETAYPPDDFRRLDLPWEAAFLAGVCHRRYRQDGGKRERTLPDFLVGAHAAVSGLALLTRDAARYRRHFPKLHILCPDNLLPELVPMRQ